MSIVFDALAMAGIGVEMSENGADRQNVIVGVKDEDYDRAIKALHKVLIM